LRNVVPITLQGAVPGSPNDFLQQAGKGFGVGTYPNRTHAEDMALGYLREQASQAPRLPGVAQRFKLQDDLTDQYRKGQIKEVNLDAGVRSGQITPEQKRQIKTNGRLSELAAMVNRFEGVAGLQKALEIYGAATIPEKAELNSVLEHKIQTYKRSERKNLTPMEQNYLDYLISRKDR